MYSNHTTSQEVNFQYYVDMVKQKKIHWSVFEKLMEDMSYSDMDRLSHLNAILLTELTVSHSDTDRLKYLNVILMNKFKNSIGLINVEMRLKENNEDLLEVVISVKQLASV